MNLYSAHGISTPVMDGTKPPPSRIHESVLIAGIETKTRVVSLILKLLRSEGEYGNHQNMVTIRYALRVKNKSKCQFRFHRAKR